MYCAYYSNMLKRIQREISNLKVIYPEAEFNLTQMLDKEYDLECRFSENKLNITFNSFYPFKAPKLAINGTNFFQIITCSSNTLIKQTYGFDCFCCESCLCSKNWGPAIRLDFVITQSLDLFEKKKLLDKKNQELQTMSNYIPGRITVTIDSNNSQEDNVIDPNYSMLKELYEYNEQNNLDKYKQIYHKFISNPEIYCFHSFSEHPPKSVQRQFYPLCSCFRLHTDPEDLLVKVHRGLHELACNCHNGKRYFALRNAYEIAYKKASGELGCYVTFSIKDLINSNQSNQPIQSPIIDWIELEGPIDKSYVEWI